MMTKKLILLLITLSTFTSESYASFPIIEDTLEATIDTLQTEKIKQYHSSLTQMGVDLNACKCESCRKGIIPLVSNLEQNKINSQEFKNNKFIRWIPLIVLGAILLILIILWTFRAVERFNQQVSSVNLPG